MDKSSKFCCISGENDVRGSFHEDVKSNERLHEASIKTLCSIFKEKHLSLDNYHEFQPKT